ncbi:hypothetical protein BGZ76_005261 [Entomortierella beljakovae]|nr:hypothetical protein BGZ76_005261 [Entomortierella beljakovae]
MDKLQFATSPTVLSNFLAGAYIFFAVSVFKITSIDTRQFLIRTVEGASVVLAALLITNSILTVIVVKREKIDRPPDDDTPLSRGTDEPPQIHIYQPRIDLTPPPLDQPDGGQDSVVTAQSPFPSSIQAAHQRRDHLLERGDGSNDNLELEILPMYQRKAPSQRVTIIDLSNLESVDPVVLNNVLGGEERGEEGGGESAQLGHSRQNSSTIAAVVASSSSTITSTIIRAEAEVPAYSPPLTTLNGVEEDLASLTPPTVSPSTLGSTPVVADETEHESNPSTIITISPSEGISATTTIGPNDPPVYMP